MIKSIPNILTLLNLFCGCIAIVLIFNQAYTYASIMIFVAAFFDFLDGTAARLLNARTEIGKQLDSLADVVSFGVAPASIMYMLMINSQSLDGKMVISIIALPAFLIALFSALRLAKFNIDPSQLYAFKGLPTPACALFIATLPFILFYNVSENGLYAVLGSWLSNYYVLLGITLLMSFLLISNLPLMGLKIKSFNWKVNQFKFIFIIVVVVLVISFGFAASPFAFILYFIFSMAEYRADNKPSFASKEVK